MKKTIWFALLSLLVSGSLVMAQMTGTVDGTVTDGDGNLVEGARVILYGEGGGGGHGGDSVPGVVYRAGLAAAATYRPGARGPGASGGGASGGRASGGGG